jgi:hypothetical protein
VRSFRAKREEGQMRRRAWLSALVVVLWSGTAAAQEVLLPAVDAPVVTGYDEYDAQGYWCSADLGNWGLGTAVRLAPTDRTDPWRPIPGMIEEHRGAIEFDLLAVAQAHPQGVGHAVLRLTFWERFHPSEAPDVPLEIVVSAYPGDGAIAGLVESSEPAHVEGRYAQPFADFSPPGATAVDVLAVPVGVVAGAWWDVDVTAAVNEAIASGWRWLGFSTAVDYGSLPDRATLPTDTDLGVAFHAANAGEATAPRLLVTASTVDALDAAVDGLVAAGALDPGVAEALGRTLAVAERAADLGRPRLAVVVLRTFAVEVRLLVRFRLMAEVDGAALLGLTADAIDGLR